MSLVDSGTKLLKNAETPVTKHRVPLADKPIEDVYGDIKCEVSEKKAIDRIKAEPRCSATKLKPSTSKSASKDNEKKQGFEDTVVTSAADCKQQ